MSLRNTLSFEKRKKRAKSFENTTGDYLRERYGKEYNITEQKRFASGRRPDAWLVGKEDHRDRIAVEIKHRSESGRAQEADLRQLRMYQHQGYAKGLMVYPDDVRVPHALRREARESNQEIVKLPEDGLFLRGKAIGFGGKLREKLRRGSQ